MVDMFVGGTFGRVAFGCQCFVVGGRKSGWTWCVFDVGGESDIFVGGNLVNASSQINLILALGLLVFLPFIRIHFSSSEPTNRHSLLVAELLLLLLLLPLSSDALLAKPPMSNKNYCQHLNVTSNSLHILLGCQPLYFML